MLCVVGAGAAGYVFEPQITPNLISYNQTKVRVIDGGVAGEKKDQSALGKAKETEPVAPKPEPVPEPVVKNDTEPAPAPTPDPAPEPTPEPAPAIADNGGEKMDETPKPEPTPIPEAAPTGAVLGEEEIVKAMQESIKAAEVKEFTFDQVLAWKAGEEEEVDGVKYQIGNAAYKAETIFGVKTIQAKALIKDGKVTKWIWPNSGMEIK
ncbi:hypothetical protein [Luteolibacter luteus]|uniref:Uncharacterized protein n=1 Tax=Luteolibacter luteus TaxID=2728835 RepID=A0A858RCV8_9BACT|nr:hypothetical protein [Luteolibacter luteus]QJE94229.1 hypothetical protein HHL09_20330 [Luteolibacter luteus]